MLSASPNGGPATFVTINGMLPHNPHGAQYPGNPPGAMFAIPSGMTTSNLLPGQNLTTGPFMLPSGSFPHNLTCTVPYSSSQYPPPPPPPPSLFPFLAHTAGGLLTASGPHGSLTFPPQFSGPLPTHLFQPQPLTVPTSLSSFSTSLPNTSALGTLALPNTLISEPNHGNGNGSTQANGNNNNGGNPNTGLSVSSTLFANQLVSSPLILPTFSFTMSNQSLNGNPNDMLPFSLAPPCNTTATINTTATTMGNIHIPIAPTPGICSTSGGIAMSATHSISHPVPSSVISTNTSVIPTGGFTLPTSVLSPITTTALPSTSTGQSSTSSSTSLSSSSPTTSDSTIRLTSSPQSSVSSGSTQMTVCSIKSEKTPTPILAALPTTNNSSHNNGYRPNLGDSLHVLESVDFHRDVILDAIDKLRERKARPDFERISCLLKRHQNINPDHTQVCLGRLAAAGAVVCVDYKGNLSYRNPSKWRKTATNSATVNPTGVSQRLVDAVRRLMIGTVQGQLNSSNCVDPNIVPLLNAQPGPNGGYSLFQIERALQASRTNVENVPGVKPFPELTGATLRVCLDREAVHGKLAKTVDGRYVLDESGERKKLSAINSNVLPTHFLNKKPIPPSTGCGLYSSVAINQTKYGKYSSVMQPIAPAGDYSSTLNRPLAVKQTAPGSLASTAIRPFALTPLQPLLSRPAGPGRRGRPPGPKSRRYSVQPDVQGPADKAAVRRPGQKASKQQALSHQATTDRSLSMPRDADKIKTETWSTANDPSHSVATSSLSISTSSGITNSGSVGLSGSLIPVVSNGVCTSTGLPLSNNFIPSLGSAAFGPTTIMPSAILPNSFASLTSAEFSSAVSQSGVPLLNFSPGLTAPSQSLSCVSTLSSSIDTFPTPVVNGVMALPSGPVSGIITTGENGMKPGSDRWPDSPGTTGPSDSIHSDTDSAMMLMSVDKTEEPDDETLLCSRCCGLSTKEDPFLVCKDCGQGEAAYVLNENPLHASYRNDNLFYPCITSRTSATFPNTLYACNSHSASVPLDISLADSMMKRPRLTRGAFNTKQFVTPSTIQRFPFIWQNPAICEKQVAYNLGRNNGLIFSNNTQVTPITTSEKVRAQLLTSRASLTRMGIPFESKDIEPVISIAKGDHSKMIPSVLSATTTIAPHSQLGNSAASHLPLPEVNHDKTVSAVTTVTSSTATVSSSETSASVAETTSTGTTTTTITATSTKTTENEPKDLSRRDASANRTTGDVKVMQVAAFKHEPRKRKAQPLTISSVTSLGTIGMSPIKSNSWDSSHLSQLSTRSCCYGSDSAATVPHMSTDVVPCAGLSSMPNIVGLGRSFSQVGVSMPIPRPQSVLVNFPGSRGTHVNCVNNSIHTANVTLGSDVVHRNRVSRNLRTNKRRLILPNTMRRMGLQALEVSRPWLVRQPAYHKTQAEFTNPFASLLSMKPRMRSVRKPDSTAIKSPTSLCSLTRHSNVPTRADPTQSSCIPSVFTPIDNVLWSRQFFGRSNPQQLVYTLVYMYARIFNLWSSAQLRRLRCGFRSQFTFVLLKPGESTKQIELLSSESENQFTAIDSNLFRGDFKPLLMLQRLRLLYTPFFDIDDPEPINSQFSESQSTTDRKNDVDMDSYFLIWESNPVTSTDWFRPYPIDARSLSLILETIRTALDCADLMNRQLLSTPNTIEPLPGPLTSVQESSQSSSPLNLVIRERHSSPTNRCSETTHSHPTCLDYWPELTERARQSPWQCSDCKTCTVCQGKGYENELLICDACDKGFHSECHEPKLQEPVDRSMPWVCAACQKEGYSVAIGTLPGAQDSSTFPSLPASMDSSPNKSDARNSMDLANSVSGANPMSDRHQVSSLIATAPTSISTCEQLANATAHQDKSRIRVSNANNDTSPVKPSIRPTNSDSLPSADIGSSNPADTPSTVETNENDLFVGSCSNLSPALPSQSISSTQLVDPNVQSEQISRSTPSTPSSFTRSPEQAPSLTSTSGNRFDGTSAPTEEHEVHPPAPEVSSSPSSTDIVPPRTGDPESCADVCTSCPLPTDIAPFASRPEDIRAWSVEHVRDWLLEEGFHREAEAFFQQEIDGACLLLMKRMDVLTELGIKLGPAVKIYERIKRLQSRCSSPNIMCS
ncbi:putative Phd finger protein [Fasciola hepatica]|uniref:Phd finger protein n=1 Tax=Fasciola hepatica TaxID=6192 RepID=A0A4E0S090_FASHE|nr:putative Phd finger protein [Fasciola hepatica]